MAFLCPAGFPGHRRRRRAGLKNEQNNDRKEKQEAVETEFEPTKMVVVRDFTPCVDDELEVKRGQHVKALYQENEWRFVVAEDGKEGFIPYTYCIPVIEQGRKPMSKRGDQNIAFPHHSLSWQPDVSFDVSDSSSGIDVDVHGNCKAVGELPEKNYELVELEFVKTHLGQYCVLFDYNAIQEDDINLCRGEKVTVLNKDDPDWYWVKTDDGTREGFIPREYLKHVQETNSFEPNGRSSTFIDSQLSSPAFLNDDLQKMKYGVKQLNVIRNYISQGKRELTIAKGEQLFTEDNDIDKPAWLWVYSQQSRKRGFVPSTHVCWSQNTTFL